MTDGVIDSNVIMHALTHDENSQECSAFMACLRDGKLRARLEPYVVHELTYAIPRLEKGWSKERLAETLLLVIDFPGVQCDRALLKSAIGRWVSKPGVSFVDALLWAQAANTGSSVFTINTRHFEGAGVDAPRPLPACQL